MRTFSIRCAIARRATRPALLAGAFLLAASAAAQAQQPLADGEVTRAGTLSAYLIDPTRRYDHGVLGDAIEAGGFAVERDGRRLIHRLGDDAVFEDRRVRLADLDGDGRPEAIVVKSYLRRGAAIAVYRLLHDRIVPLAESRAIGTRHRWLNPVGIADFTGSGEAMVAAVVMPHVAGSLRLFRLARSALTEVARIGGVTNHIIGTRNLDLAALTDVDGDGTPDVVLPAFDRRALVAVSFRGGIAIAVRRKPTANRIVALNAVRRGVASVVLEDGVRAAIDLNTH
jgi:hypothetical protein